MVLDDLPNLEDIYTSLCSPTMEDSEVDFDSGLEDDDSKHDSILGDSTIFMAFKGNIDDTDLKLKLDTILENVPSLLHMESNKLKVQKVEPWNSVRVTFSIPREAAERLRILAQNNNQQLRDLGILSVQIEGEGAINLALAQNRSQDVRMNGPMGAGNSVRMETGFPMASGPGLIRMNNPAAVMMSQGGNVSSSMIAAGANPELQTRAPRPASQSDSVDPLLSGLPLQQQSHTSGSLAPQLHQMQPVPVNRQINPPNFQQLQQQQQQQQQMQPRPPQQHQQQQPQGIRPPFTAPTQVPVPPGWNQLPSGALQPPPAQGALGTLTANQGWKKAPLPGPMQQQLQARPSLATVQTPSHPPPPYPFGSQQASQSHTNFPPMSNPGQFTAPQMKSLQGGPSRVPTPLQQPHLTNKSPASSPSSFQQGSPASSPTVNQTQQQMGPRPPQNNPLPQGFQQPVTSPGRNPMVQQGNVPPNFMVMQQQNQGPQGLHPGLGGMPKRLPPGFSTGQANQNFMQGQVPSTASGTPGNTGAPQLQGNQSVQHTGGQGTGPPQNQMQVSHGPPNMMQPSMMGLHSNITSQQTSNNGVPQVNMGNMQGQPQQGPPSQMMGMHQQIVSSQGQMVNSQAQGALNPQNPMILSRAQLMPQGQMMVAPQNQNLGPSPQRMTPPKQMIPQQGQQMMAPHNQMMGPQGQVLLQQNPMIEQIMTNQMQGNKQPFNGQNQSNVMTGPAQIMRGPTPNMQGNIIQFTGQMAGQMMAQQGPVNSNPSQVMGIQGQVLRPPGPGSHMSQQHNDATTPTNNEVNISQMMPDVSMQPSNMVPPHMQAMQGNSTSGNHFSGHGMPFNAPFSGAPNGNQISCGQNPGFPVNKDVTLTSPLLVNLLQSDISAGHFGVNNKQNNTNANKPKKKKPARKKKSNQQGELNTPDTRPAGLEESDQQPLSGEQGINLDSTGPKLSDFASRPPGYSSQQVEQRPLQQMPPQLMQHVPPSQQPPPQQPPPQPPQPQPPPPPPTQAQSQQQQQQMMMMLMMQQDPKSVRLPVSQNVHPTRGPLNPDAQRMPVQQSGGMSVMVSLQGPGSVPPSPDKQRMPLPVNPPLGNNARKMVYPDNIQNPSNSPLGEVASLPEGSGNEVPPVSGASNNLASHLVVSQNQLMIAGPKPGPSPLSANQGTSPQQPPVNSLSSSHGHHFPNVATPTQTSRPKTPNRASPRPYYPQTPNNRPPSTEPSEISLSPERLNASIAGLFPPQINIPLPPRPNLNRGFDQQGLNPTTLKAIGQAPSNLTINNPSNFAPPQTHKLDSVVVNSGKQANAGGTKRASPSSSRRSSPGSSRKTTPSPGRQNSKTPKLSLTSQTNPALMQGAELQRNVLASPTSLPTPVPGNFPNNNMLNPPNPTVPMAVVASITEDNKDSLNVPQDSDCQTALGNKEQANVELKAIPIQEMKMMVSEDQQKKEMQPLDTSKLPIVEENKSMLSSAMREAPTSLSQLLDNSGAPNVTIKPPGLTSLEVSPTVSSGEELKKIAVIPPLQDPPSGKESSNPLNLPHSNEPCSAQMHQELGEVNSSVTPNVPPIMSRPVSSSISTPLPPNQITVFVTSNPITTSSNTSTPLPSHLQPTLMSTVVTMPNVGNKVMVSEGQSSAQSSARPQFITPVFINSSSIIQVMKGSQSSTIPAAPLTSNSNLMPQPVAVVGPLHIPQSIKFSSAPAPPSAPSSSPAPSIPTNRSLVLNSRAAPMQLPSPPSTASSGVPTQTPVQQVKEFSPDEASPQVSVSSDQCPVAAAQSAVMVSPLLTSSPGSSGNRRSPVSSSKGKGKVDKIGQILLTKACKKVTGSLEKGEEQYSVDGDAEGQGLEMPALCNVGTEQITTEPDNKATTPPAPTLLKISTPGPGTQSVSTMAISSSSVSVAPSLLSSASSASAPSMVNAPVISELASTTPNTKSNHGGIVTEQLGIGLVEEKAGTHPELLQNIAPSPNLAQKEIPAVPPQGPAHRPELEANAAVVSSQSNEPKETGEKSKTPSRRNSRAEEPTTAPESGENGQRKRSSRPASASSTSKEPAASVMQSKRRKSK
ncbi:nuclear receptor coactivator 6 isoform X2 [Phascolarctos cinereus]|uniref:Nuclear receptor coactivator 6 isoform X1 n=2 Tax=Phascolarctos cinereus TaxID=38626 RepID=A0A6P5L845_PHACI|nr:nuclear receptor coactivator 6 isoform X1 [Phascolarctos cinereus]